jgi:hypothetical protein
VRHWLISDGTARHRGQAVPAGHAFAVVLWDGKAEWQPPAGAIAQPETEAIASKRTFWKPAIKRKAKSK